MGLAWECLRGPDLDTRHLRRLTTAPATPAAPSSDVRDGPAGASGTGVQEPADPVARARPLRGGIRTGPPTRSGVAIGGPEPLRNLAPL